MKMYKEDSDSVSILREYINMTYKVAAIMKLATNNRYLKRHEMNINNCRKTWETVNQLV